MYNQKIVVIYEGGGEVRKYLTESIKERLILPFLLSSRASLAGPTAMSLITSCRVKPRFLASVHINGKANWTEEIPPHADISEDFDTSFKSGVDGEWSDTTNVTTFWK